MSAVRSAELVCPACGGELDPAAHDGLRCRPCRALFPATAGLPDLRLRSDRYLDLDAERAKARRLAEVAERTDLEGAARAYYAATDDVDPKRCRLFLRHILSCETRAELLIRGIDAPGPVLDLGCGTGGLLAALLRRGVEVVGVDVASRWLVVARRRLRDHGLDAPLIAADAESLPWSDESFETVVADSLVEHLDDPGRALREAYRVLRPGGTLRLWSPNRTSLLPDPHVRLWGIGFLPRRWAEGYVRLRRGGAWLPHSLTPRSAADLVARAGFVAVRSGPLTVGTMNVATAGFGRRSLRIYRRALGVAAGRRLLSTFGPLWELVARKPG